MQRRVAQYAATSPTIAMGFQGSITGTPPRSDGPTALAMYKIPIQSPISCEPADIRRLSRLPDRQESDSTLLNQAESAVRPNGRCCVSWDGQRLTEESVLDGRVGQVERGVDRADG